MLPKINPTKTKSWKKLKEHYRVMKNRQHGGPLSSGPGEVLQVFGPL